MCGTIHKKFNRSGMANDLNTRYDDGWFLSRQPVEYEDFRWQIKQEFPFVSDEDIAQAILTGREHVAPAEGRARLREYVRKILQEFPPASGARDDEVFTKKWNRPNQGRFHFFIIEFDVGTSF
jgi:hypothetical protein